MVASRRHPHSCRGAGAVGWAPSPERGSRALLSPAVLRAGQRDPEREQIPTVAEAGGLVGRRQRQEPRRAWWWLGWRHHHRAGDKRGAPLQRLCLFLGVPPCRHHRCCPHYPHVTPTQPTGACGERCRGGVPRSSRPASPGPGKGARGRDASPPPRQGHAPARHTVRQPGTLHRCPARDAGSPRTKAGSAAAPSVAALTNRLTMCQRLNLAPALLARLINPIPVPEPPEGAAF